MSDISKRALPIVRHVLREIAELTETMYGGPPGWKSAFRKGGMGYVAELQRLQEDCQRRWVMSYLKKKKLIETKRIGETIRASLNDEGWAQVLRDRIRDRTTERTDGKKVFVVFDIPESTRKTRDAFRRLLADWGFTFLQRSIWVTRKDVASDVRRYTEITGSSGWIKVIVGIITEDSGKSDTSA